MTRLGAARAAVRVAGPERAVADAGPTAATPPGASGGGRVPAV
ncbi:hypothetical protein P9869_16660 [Streptomyces ossamyceticus]|nr:hypothetical protein [Streptomyces ossamyceticus]